MSAADHQAIYRRQSSVPGIPLAVRVTLEHNILNSRLE
jgi:hypothetical protein